MATYYVATNGNDGAAGSLAAPWRTIQRGVNALGGGDTLLIRGGTYKEAVSVPSAASGTSGAHTTIKAYTGETVVIDGEYTLPAGTLISPITAALSRGAIVASGANYLYVDTNQIVYRSTNPALVDIGANYVDFEDIKITRSLGRGVRIYSGSGTHDNVTIDNCEISYIRHHGITVYGDGCVISNCHIHHSNMFAQFTRPALSLKTDRYIGLNWGAAIGQSPSTNMTVSDCIIHSHWGEGIILTLSTTVQRCIFYDTYSSPIYLERAQDCIVERNLLYHTNQDFLRNGDPVGQIVIAQEPQGTPGSGNNSGIRIYNNIIVGGRQQIRIDNNPTADLRIYNNTLINPVSNTSKPAVCISVGGGEKTDVYIYNNIFYHSSGSTSDNAAAGADFYNNCWYGYTPTGYLSGTGDVVANPRMINPGASILNGAVAGNYLIDDLSPCIDAGSSSPTAPSDDYAGNSRTTVDIGAMEYGGSVSTYLYPNFTFTRTSAFAPSTISFSDDSSSSDTITARYWYYRTTGTTDWTLFASGNLSAVSLVLYAGQYDFRLRCETATQSASEVKDAATTIAEEADTEAAASSSPIAIATVPAPTSAGTQTIPLSSSITPTFAIFVATPATATANPNTDAIMSIGMTDGTNQRCVAMIAEDALGTANAGRVSRNDKIIVVPSSTFAMAAHAEFQSFSAGTIAINWISAPSEAYTVHVWAVEAGAAYVGDNTCAASMTVTDPNFESDVIFYLCAAGNFSSSGPTSYLTMGIATKSGAGAVGISCTDGAATGALGARVMDGTVGLVRNTGGTYNEFAPAITATGWSGTIAGTATGSIAYGCITLVDSEVWLDIIDTATATGIETNTTPAFLGGAALGLFSTVTAVDSATTNGDAGAMVIGMWDGDTGQSLGVSYEYAADPTVAKSHADSATFLHVVGDDGSTVALDADIYSDANGYQLDWSTVQGAACKGLLLLIEGEGNTYADWFLPGTTAGLLAGFP